MELALTVLGAIVLSVSLYMIWTGKACDNEDDYYNKH